MKSLRHRILALLLLVAVLPVLISLIANVTLTKRDSLQAKHEEMRSISAELVRSLYGIMRSANADLNSITTNPVLRETQEDDLTKLRQIEEFRRLQRIYTIFDSVSRIDLNGFEVDSSDDQAALRRDRNKWFALAAAGEPQITLPEFTTDESGAISITFSVYKPVKSDTGVTLSVVRGVVSFKRIHELLNGVSLGLNGYTILCDQRGKILHHPDKTKAFQQISSVLPLSNLATPGGDFEIGDTRYIYEITRIMPGENLLTEGWNLLAILPYQEAVAIADRSTSYQSLVAAFAVILGSILGFFWGGRLSSHISHAAKAAGKIAGGDLETRLPETGPSEIVALATSFNEMTKEVKQHRRHLQDLVHERTADLAYSREDLALLAAQLKAAFEASRSAVLLLRADGKILATNKLFATTFGFAAEENSPASRIQDLIAESFSDPGKYRQVWDRAIEGSHEIFDIELEILRPVKRTLNLYSAPVRRGDGPLLARLWNFRDITEQRSLEMGLRQAQKMEAVGRLAGGVAHDFNNLLQGILGNIALIEQDVGPFASPAAAERIAMARHAGQRAAQIVRQLLSFSRLSHIQLAHCQINTVISELHSIIRSTFDPRVEVTTDLHADSWRIRADATQVEQVVMNMVVNARDAMDGAGRIQITTRNVELTDSQILQMPGSRTGEFVRISVSDNGSGMPPEVITKIFEPFFTTKEQGKGTGLGLATSFGIVQQHAGWIACDSVVGSGTTFHIFLPRCTEQLSEIIEAEVVPLGPVRGGGETILLVDDEMVVRAVAQGLLKKLGYNVITADDGEAALEILHRMDGGIHLCLLDLTMPRLSGKDTFIAMRRGPSRAVPVVICSGYLVDLDGFAEETGSRPDAFVQKPYALDDLARCIRSVLDTPVAAPVA
jgi:PAS domain S-box-containing protein